MSKLCPTHVDQQTQERRLVSTFLEGARRERREQPHDTALDHEQKHPWGFGRGWAGCLLGARGGRVRHTVTRAAHTQPGMHTCTHCGPPATSTARCARGFPQTFPQHPPERREPSPRLCGTEDTAQQQGTSFEFLRHTEVRESRGRPSWSTDPSLLFVLRAQGSGRSWLEGKDRQVPGPITAFASS